MLDVSVELLREINWPLLRAGLPFISKLGLQATPARACQVQVAIRVCYQDIVLGEFGPYRTSTDASGAYRLDAPELIWGWDACKRFVQLRQPVSGQVRFLLKDDNGPFEVDCHVDVLSPLDWDCGLSLDATGTAGFNKNLPARQLSASVDSTVVDTKTHLQLSPAHQSLAVAGVATLCLPTHPNVEQSRRGVNDRCLKQRGTQGGQPIHLLNTDEGRQFLFEQVWVELTSQLGAYTVAPISFAADPDCWHQRVRLPDTTRGTPVGDFTCIDRALYACALAEAVGLSPVLLLVQSALVLHAMVALPPAGSPYRSVPVTKPARLDLMHHLVLDFTVTSTLQEGRSAAQEVLDKARFIAAIDIRACRERGILPLPMDRLESDYCTEGPASARQYEPVPGFGADMVFVPPLVSIAGVSGETSEDAVGYLERERSGRSGVTLMIGPAGAGKSYLLERLFARRLERFCEVPSEIGAPVYFPLRRFLKPRPLLVQIHEHVRGFRYPTSGFDDFKEAVLDGRVPLYLDALDEVPCGPAAQLEDFVAPLHELLGSSAEIYISARNGLIGARGSLLSPGACILTLSPWGHRHWLTYLEQHQTQGLLTTNEFDALAKLGPPMRDLTSRPLYCRMIVAEREQVLSCAVRNASALFRGYVEQFMSRRPVANEFLIPKEKRELMAKIADHLATLNQRQIALQALSDWVVRTYPAKAGDAQWRRYLNEIRIYSFLEPAARSGSAEVFGFSHEAFREYFLAEHLLPLLCREPRKAPDRALTREVAERLVELLEIEEQQQGIDGRFVIENLWTISKQRRNAALLRMIWDKGRAPRDWPMDRMDFSGLALADSDFSGCDLAGSKFINTDLSRCRFDSANLTNVDFSYANLTGACWPTSPPKRAKWEGCTPSAPYTV